jgi:hypothetical protein
LIRQPIPASSQKIQAASRKCDFLKIGAIRHWGYSGGAATKMGDGIK